MLFCNKAEIPWLEVHLLIQFCHYCVQIEQKLSLNTFLFYIFLMDSIYDLHFGLVEF